ncbi:histidinol-phosphate transaminase [Synechococcus sp. CCY9202]|uniref:pyridoxal phosphate-dependent aminotransferase n=1 Tax=Synechococcus sp. CCY9202 TaxID=174698 RepID=UPI002B1EF227|nr:histidinol-phosphate transaminase [Synechococcus sp. CCY9202]MEA5421889.1 histidinol-phosphate transaminase [Synechococcus sp. CCY9202]
MIPCLPDGPQARPEVESLQSYSAPLEGRRGLLRLDFNENTVGPSPRVVEAIRAIPADHYAIYPEYDGLREAVVANLIATAPGLARSLAPEQVGLFNGVDAAIHALFQAYGAAGDRLLTTSPTFGYYTPCARMQGMAIEAIPYEAPSFTFPLAAIRAALQPPAAGDADGDAAGDPDGDEAQAGWTPPRILLLCNPNNPTGTRLAPERILELAALAPHTLVVVDELYEAFTGDSVLPLLLQASGAADPFAAHPNLLVLRSLAKTAGLAGLRIGFAIGPAAVVDRVSRVTGPYDINSFAVTAAHAALADQPYVEAYVAEVLRARGWLVQRLQEAGVQHHVDGGNYLLIWPKGDPGVVEAELRRAGILVRSMAGKPLIDGSLRVSLGTLDQMQCFWAAYAAIELSASP